MPLVSIIIPVYNQEKFVRRSLDSCMKQTLSDIEIIVVNDGSDDATPQIIEELASQDKRIVVIHKKNGGPGLARNAGLEAARGQFVGFVDSDDYADHRMFEKMVAIAGENDADIVQCGFEKVNARGEVVGAGRSGEKIVTGADQCALEYSLQNEINNYLFCKLIKRSVIGDVRFPDLFASEDSFFLLQLFFKCRKAVLFKESLYTYVQHPESLTFYGFSPQRMDIIKSGKLMYDFSCNKIPGVSAYWGLFIVLNAVKLYSRSFPRKEFRYYRSELEKEFDHFYAIVKDTYAMNRIDRKSRMALNVFAVYPPLYALLYNLTHR